MTHAPTAGEGGQEQAATDGTPSRSIREMLSVLRDRPSILVGLVIALLGMTVIGVVLRSFVSPEDAGILLLLGPPWLATATLVGFVLWVERRPLASIGSGWPTWTDVKLGVGGTLLGLLTVPVTITLRDALGLGGADGALEMFLGLPVWALVLASITAGVTEEVLFRAYPIERITEITGRVWVGAAVTIVWFVLLHVPMWGVGHVITISGTTLIFTGLYVWTRRLAPVVIMHFLSDFVLLVVVPALGWF